MTRSDTSANDNVRRRRQSMTQDAHPVAFDLDDDDAQILIDPFVSMTNFWIS